MVLTTKQKEELHTAILGYLTSAGLSETASIFQQEAGNPQLPPPEQRDLLEKKWTSVVRLQKRVMELETKIKQMEEEGVVARSFRGGEAATNENLPRPPPSHVLTGHREPITSVAFHPTFTVCASASEDSSIKIWDFTTGQLEKTLKGHTNVVQDVSFSNSGKYMVSCSADLTIKLWEVGSTMPCIRTLRGHEHNVTGVAFIQSDKIISASRDKTLKLWEVDTGYCVRTLSGHDDWVRRVVVNPQGQFAASCSMDHTLRLWNLETGACVETFDGHEHVVECVAFLAESASSNLPTGGAAGSTAANTAPVTANGTGPNSTRRLLVSGSRDKTIKIWDSATGGCVATLNGHDNWVRGVVGHANGTHIMSVSDDKSLRVWDLRKMRCQRTISDAHDHFVSCLAYNPADPHVVTGGVDNIVRVWQCR
eukprot:TRINITY_DN1225_c0_g1::TRINITY_DN1225_c0_g1_i1::g.26866::m.26866 TRINITY_DN1225_c0_g1::TRINITY_DN1225_c0_g1_i1::g.26866  ORF type:complete len:423 (-),score=26.81,sp/D3BUN1/LIS1_POLPP/51.64/8e-148,WD40/PF00400.27/4.2e-11,WD40/PF00400.27/3.7e-10,WD40/PF00400.27/1.2e-10,WD40/PF00400.27/1.6e-10,WD40/PF00400.27/3.5e-11,WD40/PF00400.27/3e-08,WD40/PF00400.27/1.5e-08,Nup160/PF11715.3/2.9,Nup160/PF11715.3/0.009,Nup160/PF11715.3/5.1e-05,Nup160/PF11715.3/1.3,Nup160/PF11715.3/0.0082,Nucleoporin_N/PF08801.6/